MTETATTNAAQARERLLNAGPSAVIPFTTAIPGQVGRTTEFNTCEVIRRVKIAAEGFTDVKHRFDRARRTCAGRAAEDGATARGRRPAG